MPNQTMASGIHAMGGIGRSTCSTRSVDRSTRGERPTATPSPIASAAAAVDPASTRARLTATCLASSPELRSTRNACATRTGEGIATDGTSPAAEASCQTAMAASGSHRYSSAARPSATAARSSGGTRASAAPPLTSVGCECVASVDEGIDVHRRLRDADTAHERLRPLQLLHVVGVQRRVEVALRQHDAQPLRRELHVSRDELRGLVRVVTDELLPALVEPEERLDQLGVPAREGVAGRDDEGALLDAGAVLQDADLPFALELCQQRLPDPSRVDVAPLERDRDVGVRQVDELDVLKAEVRRLEDEHDQVVRIRSLHHSDLLALQLRRPGDGRAEGQEDRSGEGIVCAPP